MSKKILLILLIVVFSAGLWLFFSSQQSATNPATGGKGVVLTSPETPATSTPSAPSPGRTPNSQPSPVSQPPAQTTVVTYTDSGFSPKVITVVKGTTVVFKNSASDGVWVASNPHPIHSGYPTRGGCLGSTFDSCSSIAPGGSWPFTFNIVGTWGYHNHLNPSEGGTVVVTP